MKNSLIKSDSVSSREKAAPFKYLLARPVKARDEEEVNILKKIAGEVDLGNSRPSYIEDHIRASNRTLAEKPVPLEQGLIFLATEFHGTKQKPRVVGSCKLQHLFDACWEKNVWPRDGQKGHFSSDIEILTYDSQNSHTVEMAGNAVLKRYRGYGIGRFQTQARILYILIFGIENYKKIAANLLTKVKKGKYPFYENIVKPLLGKTTSNESDSDDLLVPVEYDYADYIRYKDAKLLEHLLGKAGERPPIQFPIHILPDHIRKDFAKVQEITERAKTILERYGLREVNKYDLLDAGQYIARSLSDFKNVCTKFLRTVRLKSYSDTPGDAVFITFAPTKISKTKISKTNFKVVRTRAILDDDHLSIPEDIRRELEIPLESEVKVLLDHE